MILFCIPPRYAPVHLDSKGGELIKDPLLDGTARSRIAGDFSSLPLIIGIVSKYLRDVIYYMPKILFIRNPLSSSNML